MEIIEVPGYTEVEKLEIARRFLLPKAREAHGLTPDDIAVEDDALLRLIREYTHESGVRNLDREIGALCRKVARKVAEQDERAPQHLSAASLDDVLGVPRYEYGLAEENDEIGVATGAAVTGAGGDLLSVEVSLLEGKGDLILTGQLGDVMQESARAAISYARSRAPQLGIAPGAFDNHTVHIHVPAGAIPKDGPSAGVTMATALISAVTGTHVRKDVAMTGEITLRGKVLPIGGLREKALAAHRGGITTLIAPKRNEKDLSELPDVVRNELNVRLVSHMDDVLQVALVSVPHAALAAV
jgi:ATP-dependent Lon protease